MMAFRQPVTRVTTINGHQFNWAVNASASQWYLRGNYEREMQQAFEDYVRPGMTVLDVGAHVGFYGLLVATLGGKVTCYEPDPISRASLHKQRLLNPTLAIAVQPFALSNKCGTGHLLQSDSMSRLSESGLDVETRTLDSLRVSPVDLIKIDVEGHETEVLEGAEQTIKAQRPVILCDYNDHTTLENVMAMLRPLGYDVKPGPPIIATPAG